MAFPTTSVLDNFNRADGGVGANWTVNPDGLVNPQLNVSSNVCAPASANAWMYWNVATYGPSSEVYATLSTVGSAGPVELYCRMVNLGTSSVSGYLAAIRPDTANNLRILRLDNDAETALLNVTQAISSGDSWGMTAVGSLLTLWYKPSGGAWTTKGSVIDTTYSAAGRLSMFIADSTSRVDNFGGGVTVTSGDDDAAAMLFDRRRRLVES